MKRTFVLCLFVPIFFANAQIVASGHASDSIGWYYDCMKKATLDPGNIILTDSLILEKNGSTIVFLDGQIVFLKSVFNRPVLGYFEGHGIFYLRTDNNVERMQLRRFAGQEDPQIDFKQCFLAFSDDTYERCIRLKEAISTQIENQIDNRATLYRKRLQELFECNIDARILSDIVSAKSGEYFQAYFKCQDEKEVVFSVDPLDYEETSFLNFKRSARSKRAETETWFSVHASDQLHLEQAKFDIKTINLSVSIASDNSTKISASLQFTCTADGPILVPMLLSPDMRVENVTFGASDTCRFIQADRDMDADLWITLPGSMKMDSPSNLKIVYAGKNILTDIGGDNYIVTDRLSWYPKFYVNDRDPARFTITYDVPARMTMLSTGEQVKSWQDGDRMFTEWDSKIDYMCAGFNYGRFLIENQKSDLCDITCYTNESLDRNLGMLQKMLENDIDMQAALMMTPSELSTDKIGKNAAIESRNAYETFVHFFGTIPFNKIIVSQQPQINFGQCWPTLVYLPFTAFFNESMRERLGLLQGDQAALWYETVASHEIAHHWWGHTVKTSSYRDAWLDEGFSAYSAALYLQATAGIDQFKKYLRTFKNRILAKAESGRRVTELGPICLGQRLSSFNTPGGNALIYIKGAYVLHMLRMMLFDYENKNDDTFIKLMKDYVNTYSSDFASTEGFKKIVEKYVGTDMDWFFDQWVYGTEIPTYRFKYIIDKAEDGGYMLTISVRQEDVSPSFKMPLHFMVNFKDGYVVGRIMVTGNEEIKKQFKFDEKPTSVEPNVWEGVLCEIKR